MRRSKLLFSSILATVLGMGVIGGVVATRNSNIVEKVEATISDGYNCITGTSDALDGWRNDGTYTMTTANNYYVYSSLALKNGTKFKITNKTWNNPKGGQLISNLSSGSFSDDAGDNHNILCNTAGNYDIVWNGTNVIICNANTVSTTGYVGWVLAGNFSATTWSSKSAIPLDGGTDGNIAQKIDISMTAGNEFRICYSDGYQLRDWKNWESTPSGFTKNGDNLRVNANGIVNVFLNGSYNGSAEYGSGYFVRYHRNNGSGVKQTTYKTIGQSYIIKTPGVSPLNASTWEPSTMKRFMHWDTKSDDSGVDYYAQSTYTTDASLYLYYIEDWYGYRYSVDGGTTWVDLPHNDAGMPSGAAAQFVPSSSQSLTAGNKITFQYQKYYNGGWFDLAANKITFEGNYNTTDGIMVSATDTIHLKLYIDGSTDTYVCHVPGLNERTLGEFTTSSATTGGTYYNFNGDTDTQVKLLNHPIDKGTFLRRGYNNHFEYETYLTGDSVANCFSQVGTSTAVECLKTGVYNVYMQKGTYGNWADLKFTRDDGASAKYLAQKFNSIISAMCTAIVSGSKELSDLQAIWGSNSSSELYKHFNGQITATLAYFKVASPSDPDISACVVRYDYIIRKYGTTALPDFIGRNNGYSADPQGAIKIGLLGQSTESIGSTAIIVAIATISAASVGGYFLIRRKKQK